MRSEWGVAVRVHRPAPSGDGRELAKNSCEPTRLPYPTQTTVELVGLSGSSTQSSPTQTLLGQQTKEQGIYTRQPQLA